ncbi:MAG: hypothetical protein L0226_15985 [Acidobacteria bacterium]|nr:hypothetical protein [Acidobacteriota bacterium]
MTEALKISKNSAHYFWCMIGEVDIDDISRYSSDHSPVGGDRFHIFALVPGEVGALTFQADQTAMAYLFYQNLGKTGGEDSRD